MEIEFLYDKIRTKFKKNIESKKIRESIKNKEQFINLSEEDKIKVLNYIKKKKK